MDETNVDLFRAITVPLWMVRMGENWNLVTIDWSPHSPKQTVQNQTGSSCSSGSNKNRTPSGADKRHFPSNMARTWFFHQKFQASGLWRGFWHKTQQCTAGLPISVLTRILPWVPAEVPVIPEQIPPSNMGPGKSAARVSAWIRNDHFQHTAPVHSDTNLRFVKPPPPVLCRCLEKKTTKWNEKNISHSVQSCQGQLIIVRAHGCKSFETASECCFQKQEKRLLTRVVLTTEQNYYTQIKTVSVSVGFSTFWEWNTDKCILILTVSCLASIFKQNTKMELPVTCSQLFNVMKQSRRVVYEDTEFPLLHEAQNKRVCSLCWFPGRFSGWLKLSRKHLQKQDLCRLHRDHEHVDNSGAPLEIHLQRTSAAKIHTNHEDTRSIKRKLQTVPPENAVHF